MEGVVWAWLAGAGICLVLLLMRLNSGQGLSSVYVIGCGVFVMLFLLSVLKASRGGPTDRQR